MIRIVTRWWFPLVMVCVAMPQPAPGAPRRFAAGTRTSSKKTSQNSASSVICRSGRTVMPGVFMSTRNCVNPWRRFSFVGGDVRNRPIM